jgi:hypothetical protein
MGITHVIAAATAALTLGLALPASSPAAVDVAACTFTAHVDSSGRAYTGRGVSECESEISIPYALAVAAATFGPAPCGHPQVVYTDGAPLGPLHGRVGTIAYGEPAKCRISLRRTWRWTPAQRCTLIVHEYGHLTGHVHSPDPRSVMFWKPRMLAACRR